MILKDIMYKIQLNLPNDESIIQVLKYIPIEEYEFSNEIFLIRTISNQYILKIYVDEHINYSKHEVEIMDTILKNTSCKVPKIIIYDERFLLMEYIEGVELSKLIEHNLVDLEELKKIAKKVGAYIGQIISGCKLQNNDSTCCAKKLYVEKITSNDFYSLLPFNVEIMMNKKEDEWRICGIIDFELMKFGDVYQYINYIASAKIVMIPGIKRRNIDEDCKINQIYIDTLLECINKN